MRYLEEERRQDAVTLRLRGKDPLRYIAAAAWLRARIPRRPPLHKQEDPDRHRGHPDVRLDPTVPHCNW